MSVQAAETLKKVRSRKPIVHHITNWVTIYDCANIVKVFGASPVMAHAKEEVAEMAQIADSLVLNIGTLTVELVDAMKLAAKSANKKGIPVILDACGAGATSLRDKKCLELLKDAKIDVIKGNASEIARLAGEIVQTRGVDSAEVSEDLVVLATYLAQERNCTVVITGAEDIVTDGNKVFLVRNGHPMMANIVGTGCMATSVIGAFCAVAKDDLAAASAAGLVCYEVAAEQAAVQAQGAGSFKEKLFDAVFNLTPDAVSLAQNVKAN
jgi:hydroxyethylthiazole kinase